MRDPIEPAMVDPRREDDMLRRGVSIDADDVRFGSKVDVTDGPPNAALAWTDDGSPRRPLIRTSGFGPSVGRHEAARAALVARRDVAFVE